MFDWNEHLSKQRTGHMNVTTSRETVSWTPPCFDFTKINFDAGFSKEDNTMGSGLIHINGAGTFLGACCIPRVADDEEQAEAKAALEAIKLEKSEDIQRLHLEGDCLNGEGNKEEGRRLEFCEGWFALLGEYLMDVFLIIPMTSNLRKHSTTLVKLPTLELSQTETERSGGFGFVSYTSEKMLVEV
ncbi:hypothetical protein C5167_029045 [Papaver somniferum]|nr:hypothetical protein C5167_029045 [Papaver somniferum]